MSEVVSFAKEIDAHKNAAEVSNQVVGLETAFSSLDVRLRGAFITNCELTSPTTGRRVDVFYAEADIDKPKLTATHSMVPAGPYEGIGGQHGFPRWADYHVFPLDDGTDSHKRLAVQAKRFDTGLSLIKNFELAESTLVTHTTIRNSEETNEQTSMGEHLYFSLANEDLAGLTINGQSLDELLGPGSEDTIKSSGTLCSDFGGEATIHFPAGHDIKLSAAFEDSSKYPLVMWIWKRAGSPSICFEPVVGVDQQGSKGNAGVGLAPYGAARLSTTVELL